MKVTPAKWHEIMIKPVVFNASAWPGEGDAGHGPPGVRGAGQEHPEHAADAGHDQGLGAELGDERAEPQWMAKGQRRNPSHAVFVGKRLR